MSAESVISAEKGPMSTLPMGLTEHGGRMDTRSPHYQDLKSRIHQTLLDRLDLDRLAYVKREDAEPEIRQVIIAILERETETTPLSLSERERLNSRFDAAISNMSQGMCLYDAQQRVVFANDRFAEIYGLTREQVKPGTTPRQILESRAANGNYGTRRAGDFIANGLERFKSVSSEVVKLMEECSAAILNRLPRKKDPGCPTITCSIGTQQFDHALCDLGASVSVMPKVVFDKLNFTHLEPTSMMRQLANCTVRYPVGIAEDILVKIRDC